MPQTRIHARGTLRIACLVVSSLMLLSSSAQADPKSKSTRQSLVETYDSNGDEAFSSTELKLIAKSEADSYDDLMGFCSLAKRDPEGFGVIIPGGYDTGCFSYDCSKSGVDEPYLSAYVDNGSK